MKYITIKENFITKLHSNVQRFLRWERNEGVDIWVKVMRGKEKDEMADLLKSLPSTSFFEAEEDLFHFQKKIALLCS